MEQEAFVYIWTNLAINKRYIGYHKGTQADGYICSSKSTRFWNDWENPSMQWKREIVFTGNQQECVQHEQSLLMAIDLGSDAYYNNARGGMIIYTDEVREKIRQSTLKRPNGMKGKQHSAETLEKMRLAKLGRKCSEAIREKIRLANLGHIVTDETREKMRLSKLGKIGRKASEATREKMRLSKLGRKHSEATLEKMRLAALRH